MIANWTSLALAVSLAMLAAKDGARPWKDKKAADWTEDDARLVLSDSPWAKSDDPQFNRKHNSGQGRPSAGSRRGRGGYTGGGAARTPEEQYQIHPAVTVRWESAAPIRAAQLKARETDAPEVDEGHYAIAVYGVSTRLATRDAKGLASDFKKRASIQCDGKPRLKPSSVEVMWRDKELVVVYLFPRSTEITKADRRVLFEAEIGPLEISHAFLTDDMVIGGKLEL